MPFRPPAKKQYMEVGGCHSAQKITDEGEVREFGSDVLDYVINISE